jgi:hypothetical protein
MSSFPALADQQATPGETGKRQQGPYNRWAFSNLRLLLPTRPFIPGTEKLTQGYGLKPRKVAYSLNYFI